MTITRRVLSTAVTLGASLTLTAAPAYASISVHKASQQFRADMLAYIPAFRTFERQFAAWSKKESQKPNVQASSAGYIIKPIVKATASLGHRMRTRQWPAQYLSDVEAFAQVLDWQMRVPIEPGNIFTRAAMRAFFFAPNPTGLASSSSQERMSARCWSVSLWSRTQAWAAAWTASQGAPSGGV